MSFLCQSSFAFQSAELGIWDDENQMLKGNEKERQWQGYQDPFSVENIPIFLDYAATRNEVRSLTSYFKKQMLTSKYIIATTTS